MALAGTLGLEGFIGAGSDVQILLAQKFLRMLAYGQTALILVMYFEELGVSESMIGMFMSLTLLGDVVLSFVVTFCADKMGRRNALILSSATMAVASLIFAV
jgi:MFS family permease